MIGELFYKFYQAIFITGTVNVIIATIAGIPTAIIFKSDIKYWSAYNENNNYTNAQLFFYTYKNIYILITLGVLCIINAIVCSFYFLYKLFKHIDKKKIRLDNIDKKKIRLDRMQNYNEDVLNINSEMEK